MLDPLFEWARQWLGVLLLAGWVVTGVLTVVAVFCSPMAEGRLDVWRNRWVGRMLVLFLVFFANWLLQFTCGPNVIVTFLVLGWYFGVRRREGEGS